jgi:3,4-dihydroxy 2-butanone 4-phosphate synthase
MSRSESFIDVAGYVGKAIKAFRRTEPVLIRGLGDQEAETDIVYPAAAVTTEDIERFRTDTGGRIRVALPDSVVTVLEDTLPTGEDTDASRGTTGAAGDGDCIRPSFSVTATRRNCRTSVTDQDRVSTITALAAAADDPQSSDFEANFHTPGCVDVLRAVPGLLPERQDSPELSLALAETAGHPPATVICRMRDDEIEAPLPEKDVRTYAQERGLAYIEARELSMVLR